MPIVWPFAAEFGTAVRSSSAMSSERDTSESSDEMVLCRLMPTIAMTREPTRAMMMATNLLLSLSSTLAPGLFAATATPAYSITSRRYPNMRSVVISTLLFTCLIFLRRKLT